MKKLFLFIPALFLFVSIFNLLTPSMALAGADDCMGSLVTITQSEKCKTRSDIDCLKSLIGLNIDECHAQGGCYEQGNALGSTITVQYCFLPKSDTQPAGTCGYIGQPCCDNNVCKEGNAHLEEQAGTFALFCYCETTAEDSQAVKNRLYCDPSGNPTSNSRTGRIYTAIGCIPLNDTNSFLGAILKWAIGIGGGIAFILIIAASFMTMTSAGNPERLKAGQELLVAAISGLILLIFSIFILKVIGVDILNLPGMS